MYRCITSYTFNCISRHIAKAHTLMDVPFLISRQDQKTIGFDASAFIFKREEATKHLYYSPWPGTSPNKANHTLKTVNM